MKKVLLASALFALACSVSFASTITFTTPVGALDTGSNPPAAVSAMAVVTTSNGVVTVTLSNLLGTAGQPGSIIDAGELLSDFTFTVSNRPGTVSTVTAGTGNLVSVGDFKLGGVPTAGATGASLGWDVSVTGSAISLEGLGATNSPADLLLGAPCSNGNYCNGNGSIGGNGPHNPFVLNSATFTINATGVNSDTTISNAVFSFGTTLGDDIPSGGTVPEPATYLLLGTGLLGLGLLARRHVFA